jgi:arylsulfatase A-like enzyme/Flp pilus assembly protein TadD
VARHVVLVTIDTLRADHLGVYGGDVATPNLDRLAAQGALAERASAHVPLTRPSHLNLMSGRLPTETGVRDNLSPGMPPAEMPLLAEVLRGVGFRTAAFVSAVVLSRAASGLERGFDHYDDAVASDPGQPAERLGAAQRRGDQTLAEAIAWLERQPAAERLFLWLHLYDPHDPYAPPEPYATRYRERPYAGEVAWSDELVGRLDSTLGRLGLAAGTLLVVTSDHGEGLGEHDELLHGFFAYESTLRVPLIVRGPGVAAGRRLDGVVGLVDLLPTILDLAQVPVPQGVELSGRSHAAALRGGAPPPKAPLYAETLVPRLHFGWSDLRVVRDGRFKYIQAPRPELYDLDADPGEQVNLVERERRRAHDLRAALERFLAAEPEPQPGAAAGEAVRSPELLAQLAALGYVGGTAPARTPTPGADPKDRIEEFRVANDLMREGLARLGAGDAAGSAAALTRLLERGVDSAELRLYLGRALLDLRRFAEAAEHFLEAASRLPGHPGVWLGLAEARAQQGDAEAALAALRAGQGSLPREAALRREEARLLRTLGRPAEARRALERWIEASPADAFAHAALGELLRDLGELDAAIGQMRSSTELDPGGAGYWNALGMILGGAGRLAEAEAAFREARRLDPGRALYAYNLGLALERAGRRQEAGDLFRQALALEPDFRPARERLAAGSR